MHGALFVQTISTVLMYGTMMPGSMLIHLIIDFVTTSTVKLRFYELIGTRGVHKIKMFG